MPEQATQKHCPKILVVEDDPGLRQLVVKILKRHNYLAEGAEGGAVALDRIRATKFDLLFLDYQLTDMNAHTLLQNLREQKSELPFVVMTGQGDERKAVEIMKLGAKDYLVKDQQFLEQLPRVIHQVTLQISMEEELILAQEELKQYAHKLELANKELQEARETERFLAYHDNLTRLPNRNLFYDRLEQKISEAQRYGHTFALLFIDLDGFKAVNDRIGHDAGDHVLTVTAERMRDALRRSDTIARHGGDEFTVILSRISNKNDATCVADKLIRAVSKPFAFQGKSLNVSASVGISIFPDDGHESDELVQSADKAMYRAKFAGKNCWRSSQKETANEYSMYSSLTNQLEDALTRGELVCHFQPQVDIETGLLAGCEALVRWQHPQNGLMQPGQFIPHAERSGQIARVDQWVLRTACEQAARWWRAGFSAGRTAINLNVNLFQDENLPNLLSEIMSSTGVPHRQLCLEITETQAMQDIGTAARIIGKLKETGVMISLDDFGSGHTSLKYLSNLPIDILKIDRSFIKKIAQGNEDYAIVDAILSLCAKLNLRVIAEGVENASQLDALRSLNCHEYQGYYHSHPVPAEELKNLVKLNGEV